MPWKPARFDLEPKPIVNRIAHFEIGALTCLATWPALHPGWGFLASLLAGALWEWVAWPLYARKHKGAALIKVVGDGWPEVAPDVQVRTQSVAHEAGDLWSVIIKLKQDPGLDRHLPSMLDYLPWVLGAVIGGGLSLYFRAHLGGLG